MNRYYIVATILVALPAGYLGGALFYLVQRTMDRRVS